MTPLGPFPCRHSPDGRRDFSNDQEILTVPALALEENPLKATVELSIHQMPRYWG